MRKMSAIKLDLSGPEGNAYVIMGTTRSILKQLGQTKEAIEAVITDAMSGDYDHLLEVCKDACMGLLDYTNHEQDDDEWLS